MKQIILYAAAIMALLLVVPQLPVTAATLRSDDMVTFSVPVGDDVYAAGRTVELQETVEGDAIAAGGQLSAVAEIKQDLMLAGGTIIVSSAVGDDLRIAGGTVMVSGSVADDLIIAGGNITVNKSVTVGGDAIITGGSAVIHATINGNLIVRGGEVVFSGIVKGTTDVNADTFTLNGEIQGTSKLVASTIKLGTNAKLGNSVEYWQEAGEIDFSDILTQGTAMFNANLKQQVKDFQKDRSALAKLLTVWTVISILSAAVMLAIFIAVFHKVFSSVAEHLDRSFWKSAGIGILYFLVTPLVATLLFVTIIGWPLALFVVFVYVVSIVFAKVLAALALAQWWALRYKKEWSKSTLFFVSILIFFILKILVLIPIIGWVILLFAVAATFGALITTKFEIYRRIEQ